ncbi:hypothetical protein COLO4_01828, partial [Corchorus olitorius]
LQGLRDLHTPGRPPGARGRWPADALHRPGRPHGRDLWLRTAMGGAPLPGQGGQFPRPSAADPPGRTGGGVPGQAAVRRVRAHPGLGGPVPLPAALRRGQLGIDGDPGARRLRDRLELGLCAGAGAKRRQRPAAARQRRRLDRRHPPAARRPGPAPALQPGRARDGQALSHLQRGTALHGPVPPGHGAAQGEPADAGVRCNAGRARPAF